MSYTGTNEPLFRKLKTESDLFTKTAAMVLARMPDDEKKWPAQIHSELLPSSWRGLGLSLQRLAFPRVRRGQGGHGLQAHQGVQKVPAHA